MNLILEGFGHYGTGATGRTNMLNGAYAEVDGNIDISAVNPRTGTLSLRSTGTSNDLWRRILAATKTKVFFGMAHFLTNLPSNSARYSFAQFRNNGNAAIVSFTCSTTGEISVRSGDQAGTILGTSAAGAFVNGAYHHVECMANINGAAGAAEVRVDGVVVLSLTGINLGSTPIAQVVAGSTSVNTHGIGTFYHADLRVGDDLGGVNDDFMGDRRVFTLFPDADGSPQQWTPLSGSAFSNIDEAAPDGDTTYIESPTIGQVSRIGFAAVPANIAQINGIAYVNYARKTDVGSSGLQVNAVSNATVEDGTNNALAVTYAYQPLQLFDEDPDIAGPWTPASVDASFMELEHT